MRVCVDVYTHAFACVLSCYFSVVSMKRACVNCGKDTFLSRFSGSTERSD